MNSIISFLTDSLRTFNFFSKKKNEKGLRGAKEKNRKISREEELEIALKENDKETIQRLLREDTK